MKDENGFLQFYDPELYELRIGPGSRVHELYRERALTEGGPVLELGCGIGDVVIALAQVGLEAWGLDASSAMLDYARARINELPELRDNVRFVYGRMEDFKIECRFAQVLLTNDVIAHALNPADLEKIFRNVYGHLVPGGRILLDIWRFDVGYLSQLTNGLRGVPRYHGEGRLKDGSRIAVWEHSTYDDDSGVLEATFRYESMNEAGNIIGTYRRVLKLRQRRWEELHFALIACGFVGIERELVEHSPGVRVWMLSARTP